MKNIVAVNTNTYHGFTVHEALRGIAQAGFKYVELTAVRGWTEHVMPDMGRDELLEVERELKDLGLTCIALSGHCNLTDKERLSDFRDNMKLAKCLGGKYIISSTGEAHFAKNEAFTDDVLIENIKALLPDLQKDGLKLGIEVHGEYGTGEAVDRIVKGVGSDLVGVNYDTANVVFYGGKVPGEDIKTCMADVNYVHLKDKIGMDNSWNFPAIGKGELDLIGLIHDLNAHGYTGPLSIEIEHNEAFTMNPKKPGDIDFVNRVVKESFDYLTAQGIL
ncbi:MAG: sugar phosphate isomerase/epimerase family protein [Clostridia bacterium]